ncbi:UNVERIFIED_CONTAM: hypothetical protein FKN15_041869 [Acipenser sinensis]
MTLLEMATSLLNHDLHWSLSHLWAVVSRGLHPRLDHCSTSLQHYRKKLEADDKIIIFSCGHLYHCQCLQSKECRMRGCQAREAAWGEGFGGGLTVQDHFPGTVLLFFSPQRALCVRSPLANNGKRNHREYQLFGKQPVHLDPKLTGFLLHYKENITSKPKKS